MNILILGGTGAMGKHLVSILSKTDHKVVVTSRNLQEGTFPNIIYAHGDAMEFDFLTTLLQSNWDVIVDFMSYTTSIFKSRINVLLAATKHYVFLSSARVYADTTGLITEDSPRLIDVCEDRSYLQTDEYALSKGRQENILMSMEEGNWTIIRPYVTYAENRLQLGILEKERWLFRALNNKTILFASDINSRTTTFTYGLDVAKGIFAILGKEDAYGEAYHITSNQTITWNDVLTNYLDILEEFLGKRPPVLLLGNKDFIDMGYSEAQIKYDRLYHRQFDNSKISKFTNVDDFIDVTEGLRISLKSFLATQCFSGISWRMEAKKDKLTKEHTPIKRIIGLRNKLVYLICRYTNLK